MSRYTAGPWVRFMDKGKTLAIMPAGRPGDVATFEAVGEGDARLMCAAPDSHEANLAFVEAANRIWRISPHSDDEFIYDEMGSDLSAAYFAARAAIAKATGAAP